MLEPEKLSFYYRGLVEGLSHAEIADRAGYSLRTIYNWRKKFIISMNCKTIFQAIMLITVENVRRNNS